METILAQFVTWNNVINDYAVNVQNLLAPALGAMVAEVSVGRNVDVVNLDLVTPFNKQRAAPQHHILLEWLKNKELREADAALAQARLSLMEFMEQQAEAAATAGRASAGLARGSGSNTIVLDVPRLARLDTSGAATLALLMEANPHASSPSGEGRTSSGRPGAGATAEAATSSSPPRASGLNGQPGSDGVPSGPGRPPGTAESASTDASDAQDLQPQTTSQHLNHFNACVSGLQQHLGPNFGIYFHVTPAACPVKGRCTHVRLMRHPQPSKLAVAVTSGAAADPKSAHNPRASARHGRTGSVSGPSGGGAASALSRAASQTASKHHSNANGMLHGPSNLSNLRSNAEEPGPPPGSAAAILGVEAVPATLVDVVYSGMTDALLKAERSVAVVGNELARLFEKYEPPLSLVEEPKNCRKLKTLPVAKEYVEANRKIQQLNAVLFKLAKATAKTAWIYSTPLSLPDGSLGDIAFMVCEAIRRVADTTWAMCKRQLDSVHLVTLLTHYEPFTITPRFTNDAATFRFELDVVVDQALLIEKTFPDFLPAQMRAVWDALLALAAVVQESRVSLGPLREQYKKLHEEVREFYTMAPEVAKAHKLSISEAAAVVRIVNADLAAIFEAEQVFEAYARNVQRIVDAYTRAQKEVKADLTAKLAELQTKLPRTIMKPNFSPEMLALARAAVNPTELAATMTLALTASNMDPMALAMAQNALAAGAMGPQGQNLAAASAGVTAMGGAGAAGLPGAGVGGMSALTAAGALQQQQQQQAAAYQQQAAAYQQQQAAYQQQMAAAYGQAYAQGMYGAGSNGSMAAHTPPPAPDAPALAAHGTSADYTAQMAMAQAYGYAAYGGASPYAMPYMYGSSTLGSMTMGTGKSLRSLPALAGENSAASAAAAGSFSAGRYQQMQQQQQQAAAAGAAAAVGGGNGVYQSAGYDSNTIAMLSRMGYGGFAVSGAPGAPGTTGAALSPGAPAPAAAAAGAAGAR
ncbi:hypothetical protein HXX76_007051 [Chlamydomonas incerta]|uniref:Uncharacterized protein n=1 Tax=Chlamydomonas incerta TaxID=51695 RepID=A0A835T1Y5_CHLIN|nr:hypothetical protein HXX76_007051 [Chlamydomonas incerta]|eukprot:KAG2435856.1 hypothetical protein HXX76_007051 [Chlamydomonas incerta]